MFGTPARRTVSRALLGSVALACAAAVGAALVSQHVYDMQPCPWCVLQRLIFVLIALVCAFGALWRYNAVRLVSASVALLLTACGMAAALWQHFKAAASASCNLTLADRIISEWLQLDSLLPDVFSPRASCADAAVNLLGVPYDFWSLGLFVAVAAVLVRAVATPTHVGGFR